MKKGIILYQSKYGSTQKYVNFLVDEFNFECFDMSKEKFKSIKDYDTIILCGGIYAGAITGLSFLKKNYKKLEDKKVAVLCVGAAPLNEKTIQEVKAHNFKKELKEIPFFYARGALDLDSLTFVHRKTCEKLQKSLAKKDPSTYQPWEEELMSSLGKKADWTDRAYLKDLILYLKETWKVTITVNRDGICAADDCYPEDRQRKMKVFEDMRLSKFIESLATDYLPYTSSSTMWSICSNVGVCGYIIFCGENQFTVEMGMPDTHIGDTGIQNIECKYYSMYYAYMGGKNPDNVIVNRTYYSPNEWKKICEVAEENSLSPDEYIKKISLEGKNFLS